ncbi:sensor domain-containing diguanylate cyclase [Ralstonia solanacearum]|uniref:GGDEF domain-containing protein n=1 Tax=Ralstonia solanacearum TaxID=305 RepID=UPI001E4C7673|nr:GGDEF domain-containing protein [Ralstonia solanacearum]
MSPTMSLDKRFGLIAASILIPILLLSCWLLAYEWLAYLRADDALRSFRSLRAALQAMEKVSAERRPTNGVLGEDAPVAASHQTALLRARQDSDGHLAQLLDILRPEHCPGCAADLDTARHLQAGLAAARANVDQLIGLPLAQRGDTAVQDAVHRMIAVIPEFHPIVTARTSSVAHGDADALNCLILARLAADLREQAGQLGSRFTGALAMRRGLADHERLAIERTRGRIDQLRAMIDSRLANHAGLSPAAFAQLNAEYFDDGLRYVDAVQALAGRPGGVKISTTEFAEHYVPTMRAITGFRDSVLGLAEGEIRAHRQTTLLVLAGTALAEVLLLAALAWIIASFRRHVVGPFAQATRIIDAIAGGDLSQPIPAASAHRETRAMFKALQVLRVNSLERMRLEHERARLMEELATMAETDSLTQLLNRRAFETRARAMCEARGTEAQRIALIMFDVDHFKRINDTYGHAAGDEALRTVADLCRAHWRQSDIVARIGGEEFAVVALVDTATHARVLAERMRQAIAGARVPAGSAPEHGMTASFGVAVASVADAPELEALLRRADHLLYQAKLAGRNRVLADEAPPSPERPAKPASHNQA